MSNSYWRRSTFCANGACVQIGADWSDPGREDVRVRDGKDPDGATLGFAPQVWAAFVAGVRADEFTRR